MGYGSTRLVRASVPLCVLGAVIPAVSAELAAQRVAAIDVRPALAPRTDVVWSRPVTVQLDNASLRHAIAAIAESASIQVLYREELLDRVTQPVTLHANKLTFGSAIERVLLGTGLQAVLSTDNVVTIRRAEGAMVQDAITGTVKSAKTQQPIAGATITVDGATASVTTDAQGTFRITAAPGARTVSVRAVGFVKQSRVVTVGDGASATIAFVLEPSASVLNEVVVTGTVVATERKAIPTPITVIDAAEIEKRGITRIEQLFRGEVPGLLVLDQGTNMYMTQQGNVGAGVSTKAYSRGATDLSGNGGMLKTYVDGVELLDPSYLGTIDPKTIERIEIITGPQAATIYGSGAMGGVMQIFTKKGSSGSAADITLSLKYGMLQSNLNSGLSPAHNDGLNVNGGTGPDFTYAGSVSYTYTGQWQPMLFTRGYGASLGATHTRGPVTASATISTSNTSNGTYNGNIAPLGFRERVENGDYDAFWNGTNPSMQYSQRIFKSASQTVSFNADYRALSWWQHHLTFGESRSDFEDVPMAPNYSESYDTLFITGMMTGKRRTIAYNTTALNTVGILSSTLTLGGTGSSGNRTNLNGCFATTTTTSYTGCFPGNPPTASRSIRDESAGGFGSWRLGFWNQLYFTFGLRAERNPNYGREHKIDWTPTNGVTYTIEHGDITLKLLGSYGRATRAPNPDWRLEVVSRPSGYNIAQYISRKAAPLLTPEYSRGPQGGLELYYGSIGSLTINHYSQRITDLIRTVTVDTIEAILLSTGVPRNFFISQYQNVGKVRQYGWEGTGSVAVGPLSLRGTYSWNDSRIIYSTTASQMGRSFSGVPTHFGSVSASYAHGGSSVSMITNFVGSYYNNRDDAFLQSVVRARLPVYVSRIRYGDALAWRRGYAKSDLSASQRLTSTASLTLNITNLGNSFVSDYGGLNPALGRQTQIGASFRLR